jgi:hypothetical protein
MADAGPSNGAVYASSCSLEPIPDGSPWSEDGYRLHFPPEEHPMTPHPFLDLAAQFARIFVVGLSAAAVIAVPVILILALLF